MKSIIKITLLLFCSFLSLHLIAQDQREWFIEFLPGIAYAPPMPLKIEQEEFPDITMTAHYETHSLSLPIYYSYRFGTAKNGKGWSMEMNHLKIYLNNPSEYIQNFSVSYGYNQLFINRHLHEGLFIWILGTGVVIAHPESTVRNKVFDQKGGFFNDGYFLSGAALQVAIQYPLIKIRHFYLPLEAKVSMGYARIPITNGHANVPALAFHLLLGSGFKQ